MINLEDTIVSNNLNLIRRIDKVKETIINLTWIRLLGGDALMKSKNINTIVIVVGSLVGISGIIFFIFKVNPIWEILIPTGFGSGLFAYIMNQNTIALENKIDGGTNTLSAKIDGIEKRLEDHKIAGHPK